MLRQLAAAPALALGVLAGCSESDGGLILRDHESFVAVAGSVLGEDGSGVEGVPVLLSHGGSGCESLPYLFSMADTVWTSQSGTFLVSGNLGLGPLGPGCVRLTMDLPEGLELKDPASLLVPADFYEGPPRDTADVIIEVVDTGAFVMSLPNPPEMTPFG